MSDIPRSQRDPATIRQSVIEAVRRLENEGHPASSDSGKDKSKANFRALTDALPTPIFVWIGIKIAYANPAALRLTGVGGHDDIVGRRATDFMQPDDRDALSRLVMRGGASAKDVDRQRFTLTRPDGSALPVEAQFIPLEWVGRPALAAIVATVEEPAAATAEPATTNPPSGADAAVPDTSGSNKIAEIEHLPPAINEDDWWSTTEVPLAAYGDTIEIFHAGDGENGKPAPRNGRSRAAEALATPEFTEVMPAIADQMLELPSVDEVRTIYVEARAATADWDAGAAIEDLDPSAGDEAAQDRPPELDEAQRLSEAALAASTNGIIITDALAGGHPIIYVNAAFERITGYGFDEVVGRDAGFLYSNDVDADGVDEIGSAITEHRSATAIVRSLRKDGTRFWSELHVVPARDTQDRVTHFVTIQNDVSERVAADRRRREAEDRLRAFEGTTAEWFWHFDAELRYAYASDRYFELTGDAPDDIVGKTIYEFQQGVATPELDALLAKLESATPFSNHVFSRTRADGSVVWFSSNGQPTSDENGAFIGYRGSARDITAALAATQALDESEQRLKRLTSGLPAVTYQRVQGAHGGMAIPYVSDPARELFGLEPADIMADPECLMRGLAPEDRETLDRLFKTSADSMAAFSAEYRLRGTDGGEKWILTKARPRRTDGGTVAWDCIAIDVSETKRTAIAIENSRNLYRTLIQNTPQLVCCIDRDGNLTFANAAFAAFFDGLPETLGKVPTADVLPDDAARRIVDMATRVFADGKIAQDDLQIARRDEAPATFRVMCAPVHSSSSMVTHVQTSWSDITETRRAEARQQESEQRLRLVMNAMPIQIAYFDGDQRYRFHNRLHQEHFGGPDSSITGKTIRDIVGDTVYGAIRPHIHTALSGNAARFEWTREIDGKHQHLETNYTPHLTDGGEVRGFFASVMDVTERNKAVEAVRDRDTRLAHLARNVPGFVYQRVVDWQGNVSFPYVSGGIANLLGVEASELAATPSLAQEVVRPEDLPKVKEAIEASRIELKPYDIEVRLIARSGETVWVRSAAHPYLRNEDNAVVWDGVVIDITRQNAAEVARKTSESRYRALVDLSPDAILIQDAREILVANPAAAKLHKADAPEKLAGRPCTDFIHPDGHTAWTAGLDQVLSEKRPFPFAEWRWMRGDGAERVIEAGLTPVTWRGKPAALGIFRDVTDRQAAKAALHASERRLQTMLNLSPDAIYINAGGRIVHANDAVTWLFGVAHSDDVIGAYALEFAAKEDVDDIARRAAQVDAGEVAPWVERRRTLPDGRTVFYETMAVPIEWKGAASRLIINRDATARHQAEWGMTAARAEAHEAESAARAARVEADAAQQVNARLIAGLGHEIRTPLNGILGMAGLLIDSGLAEDQRHHAQTIRQSGKAVLSILNDIIDLSKLRDGRTELEISDFEVRSAIESVLELLASGAFAKSIDLAAYIAPNTPEWLAGDASRLRQILLNLIGNAIKFTERGGVTVKVNVDEAMGDRVKLFIRVADTGVGIAEDAKTGLFDRTGASTAPEGAPRLDAGFGLPLCQEIVQMMNGEIGVESEPGRGSTFWFKVDLRPAVNPPADRILPLVATLAGRRALLVGGKPMTQGLLSKQLGAFGVDVTTARTGKDGLAALADAVERRAPFGVVLVDLALTDMEATEFAQRVRNDRRHITVKLMLTAPTGRNFRRAQAKELGFDAVLKKPIRQDVLVERGAALFGADVIEAEPISPAIMRNGTGVSLRVLVAEDNPANQRIVASMLIQAGHHVDLANNGIEAVNAARNLPYDLILMDVQMPEMDGVSAAKLIRALPDECARVPIIGMASRDGIGDPSEFIDAGMGEVLSKPIDFVKLHDTIKRLCVTEDEDEAGPSAEQPRRVPPITDQDRRELKDLLASLDEFVDRGN